MRHFLLITTLLLAAGTLSCTQPETLRRATFVCDGGASFAVSFVEKAATMEANGQTYRLTQQMAGSGIHYAGSGQDLRGKGWDMTWTDSSRARQCRDQAAPARTLTGTVWKLVHFQSSDDAIGTRTPPNPERYTLQFQADGNLALRLECNQAMGKWSAVPSITGGSLTLTGGAMTRAFCGPGALDTQIARDLPRIRSYTYAGANLSLALEADGGIYLWAPASLP
jgi:heat shock protein HslJ